MKPPLICVFSKHLQFLDYAALAKTCKALGLDGVDLTVRAGGHVAPDAVATDLPRAVETIRAEGLEVPMITTMLCTGEEPEARPILETASKLGIRYFRCGWFRYTETGGPFDQLRGFASQLQTLARLAESCNIVGGYHNHSGANNVGASLWDLHYMLQSVNTAHLGSNFDIGHATVVGGGGAWKVAARLMAPYVKMMAAKDARWQNDEIHWAPLGQGQVRTEEFLRIFREAGFDGPISLHLEYPIPSNEALLEEIAASVKILREALRHAGFPS